MARPDPIIQKIRDADPARDVDLDGAARSPRARHMLDEILDGDPRQTGVQVNRRGFIALVAAAILMLSTVGAVASGLFSPDQRDVEGILDSVDGAIEAHGPGWRPALNAEAVWCVYDNGSSASTYASEFPLDEPLTVERLIAECQNGNDAARVFGSPDALTVCEGRLAGAALQERLAAGQVLSGQPADRPWFPVVLGWDTDCATGTDDLGHLERLQLQPFDGIAAVNRAREVEVELEMLTLDRPCLSRDEAVQVADKAVAALDNGWFVFEATRPGDPSCHRVDLEPQLGAVVLFADDSTFG